MMVFPSKYRVAFENPRQDIFLKGRVLLVDRGFFRLYKPLCGTPDGIKPIDCGPDGCIMVALAFPSRYYNCIHYRSEFGIDVARTYLCFLLGLHYCEKCVTLGGFNFDLEAEVVKFFEAAVKRGVTDCVSRHPPSHDIF